MSANTPVKIKKNKLPGLRSLYKDKLTLIHPFFGEQKRFDIQFNNWVNFSKEIKDNLHIMVIDDHGTPDIASLMTYNKMKYCDLNLSIFRIEDDLRYNTPGALNLGLITAQTPWSLIMDSDCLFEPDEMHKIMSLTPQPGWDYKFPRKRITKNKHWALNIRYLPCTILMHKDMFLDVNGFDEDFTGQWSDGYAFFDTHFDHKVKAAGYHCGLVHWVTATEYMDDFVGNRIERSKNHENINRKLMYDKLSGTKSLNNHILRFSWKRVFHAKR